MDNVTTKFINPPIPDRRFDWAAWRGDEDEGTRYGRGQTEQEAIADLNDTENCKCPMKCPDCGEHMWCENSGKFPDIVRLVFYAFLSGMAAGAAIIGTLIVLFGREL